MCSAPEFLKWLNKEEDESNGELWQLSQDIWNNPELKYEEHRAHQLLTDFLEEKDFTVQRNYQLPTAFRAEVNLSGNGLKGPTLGVICEYDALPKLGHACGHNLIAEIGVAAALALKDAARNRRRGIPGKVVVLGTPAEEGGGGKIQMLEKGAFQDLDAVLMAHPGGGYNTTSTPSFITSLEVNVHYHGRASHAAGKPWEGLNALDAAVACYVNVALLKQQIRPSWKINGIITDGGQATNVIPCQSSLSYLLRTPESKDCTVLYNRFLKCVSAAADATGCKQECIVNWNTHYKHLVQNEIIADTYKKHSCDLGIEFIERDLLTVSTDFGNVSHEIPGLHPTFGLGTDFFPHMEGFGSIAGSREAQQPTLKIAAALAATCADLLLDPQIMEKVKLLHQKNVDELHRNSEHHK